jgi:adenylate cyclase
MSDIFISYARSTEAQAHTIAEALRALGYDVWRDDELPAHRSYTDVIEERLRAAKAVVVAWSTEAVKSQWVRAEAEVAREAETLVQLSLDGAIPPLPFNQIQCADMNGWAGDLDAPGWRKVAASVAELIGGVLAQTSPVAYAPLPLPSKPSIAVMPFANLSGDAEQEYFADGMVTEITTALSRVRSIFVIASASTLSFKGKAISPQAVGRQLGVRYVLEGSVRKAGNRVRISVQLIDAGDGAQVWADRFEDTLNDIFALQDTVALNVTAVIEPTVQTAEIRRASKRPTENMSSYDLYLRARPLVFSFDKDKVRQAIDLLDRAMVQDPDYGAALGLATYCHAAMAGLSALDEVERHLRTADELARRAVKAAGDDAEVLSYAAAAMLLADETANAAVDLAERAVRLNPGSSWARLTNGWVLAATGRTDAAVLEYETSIRLDPMGFQRAFQRANLGIALFLESRFVEALASLNEAVRLQTEMPSAHAFRAACYGALGQLNAGRQAIAAYRTQSDMPFVDLVKPYLRTPAHLTLFLDSIALAEGNHPADNTARA